SLGSAQTRGELAAKQAAFGGTADLSGLIAATTQRAGEYERRSSLPFLSREEQRQYESQAAMARFEADKILQEQQTLLGMSQGLSRGATGIAAGQGAMVGAQLFGGV